MGQNKSDFKIIEKKKAFSFSLSNYILIIFLFNLRFNKVSGSVGFLQGAPQKEFLVC